MIPNPEVCDAHFLFYAIRYYRDAWIKIAHGGAQRNLSGSIIRERKIAVPDLAVQKRIASMLGTYDDLIEVNGRRISTLDEMARRLFDEWFVDFRFPGHEDHSLVKMPDGQVPQGWSMSPLSDIAVQHCDTVQPSETPDQLFDHFSFSAFDEGQLALKERGQTILSNKLSIAGPCVLVGKLNPRISRIWYVTDKGDLPKIASTEFVILAPKPSIPIGLLYAYARSTKVADALRGHSRGASTSHQRVRPSEILRIRLPVPDDELRTLAGEQLTSIFESMSTLRHSNARLAASRDLLLPRLVSGELSIPSAERELEAVA